jgi:PhnB protein
MQLINYLHFNGTCRQAFENYNKILGGNIVATVTYGDMPGPEPCAEANRNLIAHVRLIVGDAVLMGSDSPPEMYGKPERCSVALMADSVEEAERLYTGLADGGNVFMPIQETAWAERFGMFTDRFGIPWMVCFEKPRAS